MFSRLECAKLQRWDVVQNLVELWFVKKSGFPSAGRQPQRSERAAGGTTRTSSVPGSFLNALLVTGSLAGDEVQPGAARRRFPLAVVAVQNSCPAGTLKMLVGGAGQIKITKERTALPPAGTD